MAGSCTRDLLRRDQRRFLPIFDRGGGKLRCIPLLEVPRISAVQVGHAAAQPIDEPEDMDVVPLDGLQMVQDLADDGLDPSRQDRAEPCALAHVKFSEGCGRAAAMCIAPAVLFHAAAICSSGGWSHGCGTAGPRACMLL